MPLKSTFSCPAYLKSLAYLISVLNDPFEPGSELSPKKPVGVTHDCRPSRGGPRRCQFRLARQPPHLFVRRVLRPEAYGLRAAARDQRGPGRARPWLWCARAPEHGD